MEEKYLAELIDQYLLGKISPEDKSHLEQLMASDPQIADMVSESRQAFKVLRSERNRQLREKLRKIDEEEPRQSGFLPKWIFSLLLMMVVVIGCWYWVSDFYSPASIARRYFEESPMPGTRLFPQVDLENTWLRANEAFINAKYEKAIILYASWSEEADSINANDGQWNLLLAQLALRGPTTSWKMTIKAFAEAAPEPQASKARKMLRLLDSSFYKTFFIRIPENLSVLKPRLI